MYRRRRQPAGKFLSQCPNNSHMYCVSQKELKRTAGRRVFISRVALALSRAEGIRRRVSFSRGGFKWQDGSGSSFFIYIYISLFSLRVVARGSRFSWRSPPNAKLSPPENWLVGNTWHHLKGSGWFFRHFFNTQEPEFPASPSSKVGTCPSLTQSNDFFSPPPSLWPATRKHKPPSRSCWLSLLLFSTLAVWWVIYTDVFNCRDPIFMSSPHPRCFCCCYKNLVDSPFSLVLSCPSGVLAVVVVAR